MITLLIKSAIIWKRTTNGSKRSKRAIRFLLFTGVFVGLLVCLGVAAEAQDALQINPYGNVPQQAEVPAEEPAGNIPEGTPRNPFGHVPMLQQEKNSLETPKKNENQSPSESLWSIVTKKPQKTAPEKPSVMTEKFMPSTFGNVSKTGGMNPFGGVPQSAPSSPFGNVPVKIRPSQR